MSNSVYGVILKVNDLDLCRMFYRDVIGFGEPSIDSSFIVQFRLEDNFTLTLEKHTGQFLEHASSATGWFFETGSIEELSRRLQNSGFPGLFENISFGKSDFYRGRDPENNTFMVRNKSGRNREL